MFHFRLLIFLLLPVLTYGQSDIETTEVLLNSRWDVQHAGRSENGTYFFVSRLAETNHLFLWHPEKSALHQLKFCTSEPEKALWTAHEDLIVACGGMLFQAKDKEIKQLMPDRDILAFDPKLNSTENLLLFSGQRPNQQEMSLFTFDFIYQNLNQLEGTEKHDNASWSPSDELIVCSFVEHEKKVLKLLHWYDKPFDTIQSDTLDLNQAIWSETDFRLIVGASDKNYHYVISMRKDGSKADVIRRCNHPIELLEYQPKQRKILALEEMEDGRNQLVNIMLDEISF
jgi:hypothetical protein